MPAVNFRPSTLSSVPVSIDEARDMVATARLIIDRMDGKGPLTEAGLQATLEDAIDLAFYVAGSAEHLTAKTAERRARVLAGW